MSERTFGWDDTIKNDSTFELLPEGDYDFTVKAFERAYHDGSLKLPPCNKAIMKIEVTDGERTSTLDHNLFLHSKTEGLICAFFTAVGMRKHGQPYKMDFPGAVGKTGRCKVIIDKWTGKDGREFENNKIGKFYDPEETAVPSAAPSYTPGSW